MSLAMRNGFDKPITKEQAIIVVGSVLGEIADCADMRYDGPEHSEIRGYLKVWQAELTEAWDALKP